MSAIINNLKNILHEEKIIFGDIYRLEEEKSEAIIQKDGNLLQSISSTQEKQLSSIQSLESKRAEIINKFKNRYGIIESYFITLKDVVEMEGPQSEEIIQLGTDLNKILHKTRSLQENNTKLLNDNMEYFKLILEGLKSSVTIKTGYSGDGTENREVANSLLLNKTV